MHQSNFTTCSILPKVLLLFIIILINLQGHAQELTTKYQRFFDFEIDGDSAFYLQRLIQTDTLRLMGLEPDMFRATQTLSLRGDRIEGIPIVDITNLDNSEIIYFNSSRFHPQKFLPDSKVNLTLKNAHISRGGLFLKGSQINSVHIQNCSSRGLSFIEIDANYVTIKKSTFRNVTLQNSEIDEINLDSDTIKNHFKILDVNFSKCNLTDIESSGRLTEIKLQDECEGVISLMNSTVSSSEQYFTGNKIHTYPFGHDLHHNWFEGVTIFRNLHQGDKENKDNFRMTNLTVDKVLFEGRLPNRIKLRSVEISSKLDFVKSDPDITCGIDIGESDIHKINISPVNMRFYSSYAFDGVSDYTEQEHLQYMSINRSKVLSDYKRYLSILKLNASDDDYRLLDLKYKKAQFFSRRFSSFWDGTYYIISKAWWNFGYSKGRILWWTPLLLMVFVLINYKPLEYLMTEVYEIKKLEQKHLDLKNRKKETIISRMTFSVYYTCLIFFGLKLNSDNFTFNKFWPTLYVFIIYTTGLMCLAFAFNFIVTSQ